MGNNIRTEYVRQKGIAKTLFGANDKESFKIYIDDQIKSSSRYLSIVGWFLIIGGALTSIIGVGIPLLIGGIVTVLYARSKGKKLRNVRELIDSDETLS